MSSQPIDSPVKDRGTILAKERTDVAMVAGGQASLIRYFLCHSSLVQCSHQGIHFLLEGRQVGFKNSPDDVIGYRSVAMDETIAEGNDSACVTYPGRKTGIEAEGLSEGMPIW